MSTIDSIKPHVRRDRCVICGGDRLQHSLSTAGERVHCTICFHSWRSIAPTYLYTASTMCSHGTTPERVRGQFLFLEPYIKSGAAVLEIGCATGELAALIRSSLPISRYEAIELSPAAEVAKTQIHRVHRIPLVKALAQGLVGSAMFDMVIMSHVLEHIEDVNAELGGVCAVLKPRGALFVEVPNGSGHPTLPFDDNLAHIHFFTPTSLLRLLAAHGLTAVAVSTNARLDVRYVDSIRLMAQRFALPDARSSVLSDHPALSGLGKIAVWGAGTLASELLANFFDASRIAFFVDGDPVKQGTICLGQPVYAPAVLRERPCAAVLINSIEFAEDIHGELKQLCPNFDRPVIRIQDLF